MGITQGQEFSAVLYMILCGIICGVTYDCIRLSRILSGISPQLCVNRLADTFRFLKAFSVQTDAKSPFSAGLRKVLIALGDILNGVLFGCLFSIFLANYASGVFRWFFLAAAWMGLALYRSTLSYVIMTAAEIITALIRKFIQWAIRIVLLPCRALCRLLRWIVSVLKKFVFDPVRRSVSYRSGVRYTEKIKKDLLSEWILFYERGE